PPPLPGIGGDLAGVAVAGPNNIWAVGSLQTVSGTQTLTLHWDGSAWAMVASPNPGTGGSRLLQVAAAGPKKVWAVGSTDVADTVQPLVLHWDGHTWASVKLSNTGHDYAVLQTVAVVSAADVWAAGYMSYDGGGLTESFYEHWDGSAWTFVYG